MLSRLIDHAPLFPPASLDLPDALAEHDRARRSPHAFMLARFVCPASRLEGVPDLGGGISIVLDATFVRRADVEAVELPPSHDPADARGIADGGEVYVEAPLDDDLEERLDEIAALGLRAKVRCGGAATPSLDELAAFIRACRGRNLVFKATAGLHGAIATEGDHGFLNLLAAVVFGDEERALAEMDPAAFVLDRDAFRWRDRSAAPDELALVRRGRFHSIGSCSFFEPVDELEALGVLPL